MCTNIHTHSLTRTHTPTQIHTHTHAHIPGMTRNFHEEHLLHFLFLQKLVAREDAGKKINKQDDINRDYFKVLTEGIFQCCFKT